MVWIVRIVGSFTGLIWLIVLIELIYMPRLLKLSTFIFYTPLHHPNFKSSILYTPSHLPTFHLYPSLLPGPSSFVRIVRPEKRTAECRILNVEGWNRSRSASSPEAQALAPRVAQSFL